MSQIRDSQVDFRALAGLASERLGVPLEFVEKDYWVTELLRSVSKPLDDAHVVFKGGTSLSKGYGLIARFSEDVDILLVVTREPSEDFGKGSIDAILKLICNRATEDLGLEHAKEAGETGVHRSVRYTYPALFDTGVVRPGVKLEMGTRGTPVPSEELQLRPLMAEVEEVVPGEFDDLDPLPIVVLRPERTLFEKLALVHGCCSNYPTSAEALARAGRHFYDIGELLNNGAIRETLSGADFEAKLVSQDVYEVSMKSFGDAMPRPAEGYAASPAFDPDAACHSAVIDAYAAIQNLLLQPGSSIDDVNDIVRQCRDLL